MLLSEARTRVANVLDDAPNTRWTVSEIDTALLTGQTEVMQLAVGSGSNLFRTTTNVSSSAAGLVDLTAIKPLRIVDLAQTVGTARYPVLPASIGDIVQTRAGPDAFQLVYVPRPSFPTAPGNAFVWSTSQVVLPQMDALMCFIAASELKVKEGEVNAGIEVRKQELRNTVMSEINVPSWRVMSMRAATRYPTARMSGLYYVVSSPDVLQIAYA